MEVQILSLAALWGHGRAGRTSPFAGLLLFFQSKVTITEFLANIDLKASTALLVI